MNIKTQLIQKLHDKTAKIGVLGMGYVGLPLSVVFAEAGYNVLGIDPDKRKVEAFNQGRSYIQDITSETIDRLHKSGCLNLTADFAALAALDAVSICVPTPLRKTGDPDMSYILSAVEQVAKYVHPGMVIVLESTTYPGTTREVVVPKLTEKSGLRLGEELFVCFSPERVDPGRTDWTTYNTPKVIGGITPACVEVATEWYRGAIQTVVPVSSTESAELAKLLENTFRMINIGLVNELAIMCERLGVDVWEVIDAAATKPFGFMKFTPGPGLGGHCIPIDPLYLSWKMKELNYSARFIELASEINTNMPRYVVNRLAEALNEREKPVKNSRILVLGVAYKADIEDVRESPAFDIIALLKKKGAIVSYHDPFVPHIHHEYEGWRMDSLENGSLLETVRQADAVLIVTPHKVYDYTSILENAQFIFDSRNAMGEKGKNNPRVEKL